MPQPMRLGHVPRRHLAPGQRPVGEVVERPLAERRLVDRVGRTRPARDPGRDRVTVTSIALFDEPTIRPTISISPSRRTSQASVTGSEHPTGWSVDVVAVAPRADVALRVERLAAQRARRAARRRRSGPRARRTTGPRRRSSGRAAGRGRPRPRRRPRRGRSASPSSAWARASTRTRSASPSQPRVSEPARNASLSGSSSGPVSLGDRRRSARRRLGDAAPLELGEQLAEAVGEDRDLDLLEQRR